MHNLIHNLNSFKQLLEKQTDCASCASERRPFRNLAPLYLKRFLTNSLRKGSGRDSISNTKGYN